LLRNALKFTLKFRSNFNVNFNALLSKYNSASIGKNKKDFNNIKMQGTTMETTKYTKF
jgi:hypothetical protein